LVAQLHRHVFHQRNDFQHTQTKRSLTRSPRREPIPTTARSIRR
jgi:hypothetical protein